MSLTLALLREDLRTHLGMDSSDLDDTDADRLLNRSWWSVSSQLRFKERDGTHNFDTVAGTRSYNWASDMDAVQRIILRKNGEDEFEPLAKIDDWNMFAMRDDNSEFQERPTQYSLRNNTIIFDPVPDDIYNVSVKYLKTLADLQSSGPDAPQEWHEVILWGAISRGFFSRGDWSRGTAAQNQQLTYMAALDTQETKSQEDRTYSGFRVIRRRYP